MFGDVPLQLKRLARVMARQFPKSHMTSYGVGLAVVAFYLGERAYHRILDELLAPQYDDRQRSMRVILIAQALFTLRRQSGLNEFCRRFGERGHRSIYFEANSAAMFCQAGFAVAARREKSVITEDFDFAVRLGDHVMAVEVTELRGEAFSAKSLLRALNDKRRQLPPDHASCLHCYYPAMWNEQTSNLEAEVDEVVADFFRRSGRVNYLTLSREEYRQQGKGFAYLLLAKTYRNLNARHEVGEIDGRVGLALNMPDYSADIMQSFTADQNWTSGQFQMFVDYVSDLGEFNRRLAAGVYGGMPPSAGS